MMGFLIDFLSNKNAAPDKPMNSLELQLNGWHQ